MPQNENRKCLNASMPQLPQCLNCLNAVQSLPQCLNCPRYHYLIQVLQAHARATLCGSSSPPLLASLR